MTRYVIDELYRIRMLLAGIYTGIGISSTIGFSLFTEFMRSKYGFDQRQITTISTTGNCVGYLSFFSGMLFDYAGPKVLLPISGALGCFGFMLFGLAFDDAIPTKDSVNTNMIQFCIFLTIVYFGSPSIDVATVMPLMLNFPRERGYVVIIQKTFSGLGTSILMSYFNGWFLNLNDRSKSSYSGYAYFVACQLLLVTIVGAILIDLPPYYMTIYRRNKLMKQSAKFEAMRERGEVGAEDRNEAQEELEERREIMQLYLKQDTVTPRIMIACVLVGILVVVVTLTSIITAYVPTTKAAYIGITVVIIFLLCCFAVIALPFQFLGAYPVIHRRHPKYWSIGIIEGESDEEREAFGNEEGIMNDKIQEIDDREPVVQEEEVVGDAEYPAVKKIDPEVGEVEDDKKSKKSSEGTSVVLQEPQYQGSFWRHLLTLDLWLFWFTFFGLWGTGTVINMNAAQLYRSINNGVYDPRRQSLYVALIGLGSAVGRIISGVIDMRLTQWRRDGVRDISTTLFLPVGCVLLFFAYLIFSVIPPEGLVFPFLVGSLGTGMGWALGALSVKICYARDVGKHYNFMFSSGFVSVIALNRFMFGEMFDGEAKRLKTFPLCGQRSCVRNQCFILMCINVFSACTGFLAHWRFSRYVKREKKMRLQQQASIPEIVEQE